MLLVIWAFWTSVLVNAIDFGNYLFLKLTIIRSNFLLISSFVLLLVFWIVTFYSFWNYPRSYMFHSCCFCYGFILFLSFFSVWGVWWLTYLQVHWLFFCTLTVPLWAHARCSLFLLVLIIPMSASCLSQVNGWKSHQQLWAPWLACPTFPTANKWSPNKWFTCKSKNTRKWHKIFIP